MRAVTMTAMMMLAVSGLSACNRNKAANNTAATANSAAPAPAAPAAAPAAPAAGGMDYRTAFVGQCEQQARANPNLPAGIDVGGACGCAYDSAFPAGSDPMAAAQDPAAQQRFAQALAQCLQERAGGMAPPGATAPEGEGEGEAEEK